MSDRIGALYIRVSTDDQAELSPDAQKRLLLDYAKKNGIIISNDFIFSESISRPVSHQADVTAVWQCRSYVETQDAFAHVGRKHSRKR